MSVVPPHPHLGLDVFSLRFQQWSPFEHLDFCAAHGIGLVHFSEPRLLGGLDRDHLRRVRAHAAKLGLQLEIGMLSICRSSSIFDASLGTPDEQLVRMIDAAAIVGSRIVRCVVGRFPDRLRPGGVERLMDEAVAVLHSVRTRALDAGVSIAIENHAGDLQARELRTLIEAAGPDFTGACLDAGNALWAMEDPHLALDLLAPYVLTSHTRDAVVCRTEEGVDIAWTAMGRGNIRIADYLRTFSDKCPGLPLTLEIIVLPAPRSLPFRDPSFWDGYQTTPAWQFQRFLDLVDRAARATAPSGPVTPELERQYAVDSIGWTRSFMSLFSNS